MLSWIISYVGLPGEGVRVSRGRQQIACRGKAQIGAMIGPVPYSRISAH